MNKTPFNLRTYKALQQLLLQKASKQLKHKVLAIKENPEYPYVGVAYNNGVLELLSLHNPKVINLMTTFNLSKNPLNSIYFTNVGKLMIAADTVLGEFFIIEVNFIVNRSDRLNYHFFNFRGYLGRKCKSLPRCTPIVRYAIICWCPPGLA